MPRKAIKEELTCGLGNFTHQRGECSAPASCNECLFRSCSKSWKFKWAQGRVEHGTWGLGCTLCAAYLRQECDIPSYMLSHPAWQPWAKFKVVSRTTIQKGHMTRHANSRAHRAAHKHHGGKVEAAAAVIRGTMAPSKAAFGKVIRHLRARHSRTHCDGVADRKKVYRMAWCVAEGYRTIYRRWLREAKTIALHQDRRCGDMGGWMVELKHVARKSVSSCRLQC